MAGATQPRCLRSAPGVCSSAMTNRFGIVLNPDRLRWAAAEGMSYNKRDEAAKSWRKVCRERVAKEVMNHKGTPMAEHWKLVLSAIDSRARFPLKD